VSSVWLRIKKLGYKLGEFVEGVSRDSRRANILTAIFVALAIITCVLIRIAPYPLNDFEFFEFDSYIEYWQAKYVYEKGPMAWYTLTRSNPDTHIFWYPWGRDFTLTSYPFFPLWIGTTYHLVKYTGLSLEQWAALQPILFAIVATVVAYFAAREVFNSRTAGIAASFFFAILPAAIERTVIGYVEKEGAASVFVFLFIYFYAKSIKAISSRGRVCLKYIVPASLSLALIGWLWGGYVFILGTVVVFALLSPIILGESYSRELALTNLLVVLLAIVFEAPSPANLHTLGLYPMSLKSIALILLVASVIPFGYYYLSRGYRSIGLKKPLLNRGFYTVILVLILIVGALLTYTGMLPIGGRLAWALGLRVVQVTPLVESIAEHQPALASTGTFINMLNNWGVIRSYDLPQPLSNQQSYLAIIPILVIPSALFLAIIGLIVMVIEAWPQRIRRRGRGGRLEVVFKAEPEELYVGIAFAITFYSYLNAVYMIGAASYFGIFPIAVATARILEKYVYPFIKSRISSTKTARVPSRSPGWSRLLAVVFILAVVLNSAWFAYSEYRLNSNIVYTLRAGVSDLSFYSDSWRKTVETLRKDVPPGSLVISWWDYGYGISVAGGRVSAADGSTINETQIGIIGLILTSSSTENAAKLAKLLSAKRNETYIMVIDGVIVSESNETVYIVPLFLGRGLPGLVDWPKSVWMIRIGNGQVPYLRSLGLNISYVDTEKFFRVYNLFEGGVIAPKLDDYNATPIIYKIIVDATLYWAESMGKKGQFVWFTGSEQLLSFDVAENIRTQLKLNISLQVTPTDTIWLSERPFKNDSYLAPYRVIMEPFIDPKTGEPLKTSFTLSGRAYSGVVYSVVVIYQLVNIPESQ